jgi:hypothetical protein
MSLCVVYVRSSRQLVCLSAGLFCAYALADARVADARLVGVLKPLKSYETIQKLQVFLVLFNFWGLSTVI